MNEHRPIRFDDIALAAAYINDGHDLEAEPPADPDNFVTFIVARTPVTERMAHEYATGSLRVDPRRFYDALGIAKRLVHRAREAAL